MVDPKIAIVLSAALVALGFGLAGCNAVQGMGDDVTAAGTWVSGQFDSSDRQNEPDTAPQSPTRSHSSGRSLRF